MRMRGSVCLCLSSDKNHVEGHLSWMDPTVKWSQTLSEHVSSSPVPQTHRGLTQGAVMWRGLSWTVSRLQKVAAWKEQLKTVQSHFNTQWTSTAEQSTVGRQCRLLLATAETTQVKTTLLLVCSVGRGATVYKSLLRNNIWKVMLHKGLCLCLECNWTLPLSIWVMVKILCLKRKENRFTQVNIHKVYSLCVSVP